MNAKLTKEQAYELGYKHGAEMARESGSADPGCDGWDGMLINADVRFCVESFGDDFRNSAELAEYVRGAQAGANEQLKPTTPPDAATNAPFILADEV